MKFRPYASFIGAFALSLLFAASPVKADERAPANAKDAMKRVGEQGMTEEAMDYQQQFLASIGKELTKAVEEGAAAKGKSDFDLLFVIGTDGHIKSTFLTDPEKQPLGKYVASKLTGAQAAKPPKDNWVVYLSQERK